MASMTTTATESQTLTPEAALDLMSGDYDGVAMRDVFDLMEPHDHDRIAAIAASLLRNGWVGPPIKVHNGTVLDGHHRLLAAHRVGIAIPHSERGGYSWESQWRDVTSQRR